MPFGEATATALGIPARVGSTPTLTGGNLDYKSTGLEFTGLTFNADYHGPVARVRHRRQRDDRSDRGCEPECGGHRAGRAVSIGALQIQGSNGYTASLKLTSGGQITATTSVSVLAGGALS